MAKYPTSELEATLDGGTTTGASIVDNGDGTAYVNVGNEAKAAGQVGVRVKAATGRNASAWLFNAQPFTASTAPLDPLYSTLSNVELILNYKGLVQGQTTAYGTVDSAGKVTMLRSIVPAPVRDFPVFLSSGSVGAALSSDGIRSFGGAAFENTDSAAWRFLHGSPTDDTGTAFTIHALVRFGHVDVPNALIGLMGTNEATTSLTGFSVGQDTRTASSKTDSLSMSITKSVAGQPVLLAGANAVIPSNVMLGLTIEVNLGGTTKVYINNQEVAVPFVFNGGSLNTDASRALRIFSMGAGIGYFQGFMKELVVQRGIESQSVREVFMARMIERGAA